MGVDISHIVRHEFEAVEDRAASMAFVEETMERLKRNLLIRGVDDCFDYYYDEEYNETTFRLPVYDVEFTLHNGFWQIESFYHYCQIVMHHGSHFWLRRLTFDIAHALGQDEAWYAAEYFTWNGGACELPGTKFDEWLSRSIVQYGKDIPEFDQEAIMVQGDVHIPDHEPIYHDSFRECKSLFDSLQSRIVDYRLLGISLFGNGYLRCEKDENLYLIHEKTLKPLFDTPIEAMHYDLNGPEIVVIRDGLSALFDEDGKQLTDFVKGRFKWKWSKENYKRIIYNQEAGIELPPR